MKILITGPQGSGKTTQSKLLSSKLGLCLVGAGDLIREFSQKKQVQSEQVKKDLAQGELVDSEVVYQLVKERLGRSDCTLGYVSDGYPRSELQAKIFDPEFDKVIYLDVPDEVAKDRLLKRGRTDDKPEIIDNRLYWYHHETEPLLKKYQSEGKLFKVNGNKDVNQIATEILNIVTSQ